MKNEIPNSGSLKHYNIHQILAYLNKLQKTGILTIEDKKIKKTIYIENGFVIFASSNQVEDRLGMQLIRAGKITPEQRDKSLNLSKESNKRHGITLVELGYLTPKDLFNELRQQIKMIILNLFFIDDGMFHFKEKHVFSEVVKIKINIDHIIREGLMKKEMKRRSQ
ncbi:MAG: DUF4388 domain-containing protein [Nitrospirae bacterium]|nr:DUF4388 domain-containing protein [Nitrospirota bacterium]